MTEQPHRAYYLPDGTWVDPDCFECGGQGAPCCEPPYFPPGLAAVDGAELERLQAVDRAAQMLIAASVDDADPAAMYVLSVALRGGPTSGGQR